MGICVQKKNKNHENRRSENKETTVTQKPTANTVNLNQVKFKDMQQWGDGKFSGEGIKRINAYKCNLKINELEDLREEFWTECNKTKEKQTWKIIKRAIYYDSSYSEMMLQQNNLRCLNGTMNQIVDSKQNIYNIPNFCINLPHIEKEIFKVSDGEIPYTEISITLYDVYDLTKTQLHVSCSISGNDIKAKFCETRQIDPDNFKIRLLYRGAEIKEEHLLYQHKVVYGGIIQVIKNSELF